MAPIPSPPALQEATRASTAVWQANLQSLFLSAKDRFPDVVWELTTDGDEPGEVWGHKAIVYARAPPSFQARYFSFRPAPTSSPLPYSSSPTGTLPGQSSLSLALDIPPVSRSPSPFRTTSPTPSNTLGTLLHLKSSINSILFSNELEYLYTGKGFGEAFEFLFDTSESREEGDAEENRIDKLRKDLVFMWRSRLYSDIRIALTGNFSSTNHEDTTAIFSSHRFVLVSRSPYFLSALSLWGVPKSGEPLTLNLPSPPFTPASLHFTLGFIYTGTLIFSHRTYDLDTAFHIMRSATYLALDSLYNEIQARIVQEMMHGLFHAFLEFSEYERITGGKWGTGGCRCRQCARRAPRVLEFALSDDVKNPHLERGARRALVGLFGEGWCTPEFAGLPQRTKDNVLKGLAKRTTTINVFALLFATQHALKKFNAVIDAWADGSREMILAARKTIDDVLCSNAEECFEQPEWLDLLQHDGIRFEDGERVEAVMEAITRGITEKNAPMVYQVLVSSILLRPHATETDATILPSTSPIRMQVEDTRMDIVRWMRKRWMAIRQEHSFNALENWAIKEISHEIEVPVDDLLSLAPSTSPKSDQNTKKATLGKVDCESDSISMHSLRTSVLNRNKRNVTPTLQPLISSGSSVRSAARSAISSSSQASATVSKSRLQPSIGPRPDSKLTPSSPSVRTPSAHSSIMEGNDVERVDNTLTATNVTKLVLSRPNSTKSPRRSVATSKTGINTLDRPKSSASSFVSVRSQASTLRNAGGSAGLCPPPTNTRPISTLSTATTTSSTFKTAHSEIRSPSRSRRTSAASTISNVSAKVMISSAPKGSQSRPTSTTSVTSSTKPKRPAVPPLDPLKLSPAVASRSGSAASTRSTRITSSASTAAQNKAASRRSTTSEKNTPTPSKANGHPVPTNTVDFNKDKCKVDANLSDSKRASTVSSASTTVNGGVLKRKGSSDTITKTTVTETRKPRLLKDPLPICPRGATLEIGIPCIISSKRKRFKAFARYIGEVEGELGPWVGVEVPVGDSWAGEKLEEGRQWNDGSWGGIRYFEIGGFGSDWDYGDDRVVRRRKVDNNMGKDKGLKREGDQLSIDRAKRFRSVSPTASDVSSTESRGLFVRPQQVLYVVDAVGSDI